MSLHIPNLHIIHTFSQNLLGKFTLCIISWVAVSCLGFSRAAGGLLPSAFQPQQQSRPLPDLHTPNFHIDIIHNRKYERPNHHSGSTASSISLQHNTFSLHLNFIFPIPGRAFQGPNTLDPRRRPNTSQRCIRRTYAQEAGLHEQAVPHVLAAESRKRQRPERCERKD